MPSLPLTTMAGRRSAPPRVVRQSMTTRLAIPVDSSSVSEIDWPSTRSSNADRALDLGQNRPGIRIPFRDALAALDHVAFVDVHARAVLDAVGRTLGAVGIGDRNHHVADHRDQVTFAVLGDRLVLDRDLAVEIRLDERLLVDLRRAADVEGTHRQLRAGLADRLRRDDADRFAVVDRRAAGEIAAVALAADAVDEFAGQRRADLHFLDAGLLDGVDMRSLPSACRA